MGYNIERPNERASLAEADGADLLTFMKRWSQPRYVNEPIRDPNSANCEYRTRRSTNDPVCYTTERDLWNCGVAMRRQDDHFCIELSGSSDNLLRGMPRPQEQAIIYFAKRFARDFVQSDSGEVTRTLDQRRR